MALRPEFTLEAANRRGTRLPAGLFGFRVTAIDEDRLDAELDVRPEILAPNGYLHAATVVALADTACGYGCLAHLAADAPNFTTIELKTNFLGTAREGTIALHRAPGAPRPDDARVGRNGVAQGRPRTIALFRCTQMILYRGTLNRTPRVTAARARAAPHRFHRHRRVAASAERPIAVQSSSRADNRRTP